MTNSTDTRLKFMCAEFQRYVLGGNSKVPNVYFFNVRLRMKFHTVICTRPQKRILIMNYGLVFG